jgi:hypothetical protein
LKRPDFSESFLPGKERGRACSFFPAPGEPAKFIFALFRKPIALASVGSADGLLGVKMVGRSYLSRQMLALLNFARETNNPELSALLVQKAARLKSQADEINPPDDIGPRAPDVQSTPRPRRD